MLRLFLSFLIGRNIFKIQSERRVNQDLKNHKGWSPCGCLDAVLAVAVLGVVIVIDAAAVAVVVVLCENVKLLLNNHSALSGPRGEHYKHCEEKFPMRMQGGDLIKMFSA